MEIGSLKASINWGAFFLGTSYQFEYSLGCFFFQDYCFIFFSPLTSQLY